VSMVWRQKNACENAVGGPCEHRPIPQVPPKREEEGAVPPLRVPASGSGMDASRLSLVRRSLRQLPGERSTSLPSCYTEGNNT
jgi:hypothetical protein